MKKIIKRFFIFSSLGLFISIIIIVILGAFFRHEIEGIAIKNITSKITSQISFSDASFNIHKHFPLSSVEITNLKILEKEDFGEDTLIYAQSAFVKFSILDLVSKKFDIDRVIIRDGMLKIKYDTAGSPNYLIFKKTGSSKKLKLKELQLLKTKVHYTHNGSETDISFLSKDIMINLSESIKNVASNNTDKKKTIVKIDGDFYSNYLKILEKDYLTKKEIDSKTRLVFCKDTIFVVNSELTIENLPLKIDGSIAQVKNIDLLIESKGQKIHSIIKNTPTHLQGIYDGFQINGLIDFRAAVNGHFSKKVNPSIEMNFLIQNGSYALENHPFKLNNISIEGYLKNGDNNNFKDTEIWFSNFNCETRKGLISGVFNLKNLNDYYLEGDFDWNWDLKEVNAYFKESPFLNLTGKLHARTNYKGNISFNEKFKDDFLKSSHKSKIDIENMRFVYEDSSLVFNIIDANCLIKNRSINVLSSKSTINDSDIDFEGVIEDFIKYLLDGTKIFSVSGNINSIYTNFDEIITVKDISNNKSLTKQTFPQWINFKINTKIENMSISNLTIYNLDGNFDYIPGILNIKNTKMNALNGEVMISDAKFFEKNWNYLKLDAVISLKGINIRNGFSVFNNFGQEFIQDRHLKGIADANIELSSGWKSGFILDEEALVLKSDMIIKKGELNKFKPLKNLSTYINIEDLRNVKFSTLENTIQISNKKITIPAMEIKSSALSVYLEGTHTFDQKIDYQIKVLLSELLSNKFRKKNTEITNEEILGKNNDGLSTIYLKMTGDTDNPKFAFDKIKIKEKLKNEMRKEKELIKNIIKNDVFLKKDNQDSLLNNKKDITIEWNDEP